MSTNIATRLNDATRVISERREQWKREHPNEDYNVPACPICKGTGLKMIIKDCNGVVHKLSERYNAGMYEYFEPCKCTSNQESRFITNRKNIASVPALYKDARLNNFRLDIYTDIRDRELATSALKHVNFYVLTFQKMFDAGLGLFIYSRAKGCGKSRLAATISNELSERGYHNKYASASTILSEIQASWNDKNQAEYNIIKNYIKPDLLIIDDFGARSGQHWMDEKFFLLLDARYQEKKPTIITSNFEVERLPFDDTRIIDRITDVERFHIIKMPNNSVRQTVRTGTQSAFFRIAEEERKKAEELAKKDGN